MSQVIGFGSRVAAALLAALSVSSIWVAGGLAAALPNPCTLLANAHAGTAFGKGKALALGAETNQKYGTGKFASASCLTSVGTQKVSLGVSFSQGGFGRAVYVAIGANGASPDTLTSFARQVYKLLH